MELGSSLALIFLVIMTLAGILVFVYWGVEFIQKQLKKARLFAKTKTVMLMHKKLVEVPGELPDYFMVFRDEQYQQFELQADVIQYDAWIEGTYGKLTYEGKKCVSFEIAT